MNMVAIMVAMDALVALVTKDALVTICLWFLWLLWLLGSLTYGVGVHPWRTLFAVTSRVDVTSLATIYTLITSRTRYLKVFIGD